MSSADLSPKVHIGEVVRNAVVFHPGKEATVNPDSLIETVARFFDVLAERQIDYVLVGGIALLQCVEGRNTEDIDLIMASSALSQLPELIIDTTDSDFARGHFKDLKVEVLLTSNPLFDEVRQRHTTMQRFVEQDIPCATVEGLVLLKLYALPSLYRDGNFTPVGLYENDIATLLLAHNPSLDLLLTKLASYLSERDLSQVKQIVKEIQQRITASISKSNRRSLH